MMNENELLNTFLALYYRIFRSNLIGFKMRFFMDENKQILFEIFGFFIAEHRLNIIQNTVFNQKRNAIFIFARKADRFFLLRSKQ